MSYTRKHFKGIARVQLRRVQRSSRKLIRSGKKIGVSFEQLNKATGYQIRPKK